MGCKGPGPGPGGRGRRGGARLGRGHRDCGGADSSADGDHSGPGRRQGGRGHRGWGGVPRPPCSLCSGPPSQATAPGPACPRSSCGHHGQLPVAPPLPGRHAERRPGPLRALSPHPCPLRSARRGPGPSPPPTEPCTLATKPLSGLLLSGQSPPDSQGAPPFFESLKLPFLHHGPSSVCSP